MKERAGEGTQSAVTRHQERTGRLGVEADEATHGRLHVQGACFTRWPGHAPTRPLHKPGRKSLPVFSDKTMAFLLGKKMSSFLEDTS